MQTFGVIKLSIVGALVVLAGCASTTSAERAEKQEMADTCPMQARGTKVSAIDVEGGAAIDFIAADAKGVAELRDRTLRMAGLHNDHHEGSMKMMITATASVADLPGGARFILRPADLGQLDALRDQTRKGAERMAKGECPMMSSHHVIVAN